jgi:hypothetical protein
MQVLKLWSFWKVLLVSGGWILLTVLLVVAWVVLQFRGYWAASSAGSAGIGAVSFSVNVFIVFLLVIPLGPPFVLILAWLIARRS